MSRRRTIGSAILTAALVAVVAPAARAGAESLAPGVESAADAILKSGYGIERQMLDATTVRVDVLRGGSVLASAKGRIGAPPRRIGEKASPAAERAVPAEPVLARIETAERSVSTP